MILVFAHDDALGKISLAEYLGRNCPEPLLKILEMYGNRYVLFDNTTKDELKKSQQRKELLHLVDTVVLNNGGISYSNELLVDTIDICECGVKFNKAYEELLLEKIQLKLREASLRMEKQTEAVALAEINRLSVLSQRDAEMELEKRFMAEQERLEHGIQKKLELAQGEMEMRRKSLRDWEQNLKEKFNKSYGDQLREMESKHREMSLRLEKQLEVEQVARMQAEADQVKSNDEINRVKDDLERAQREVRELQKTHRESEELLKKMIQ